MTDGDIAFSKSIGWTKGERTGRYAIIIDHGKVVYAENEPGGDVTVWPLMIVSGIFKSRLTSFDRCLALRPCLQSSRAQVSVNLTQWIFFGCFEHGLPNAVLSAYLA